MELEHINKKEVEKPNNCFGVRHVQYFLLFTATVVAYAVRIAFNVGIIAITSNKALEGVPTYPQWTSKKNVMLSSFFWGYIAPQVVAGQLAKHYGAKWFLGVTTFLGSLFSLLIPYFASVFGYEGVIFCRVVQGFGQSFLFPCVHTLLSKWTAVEDRAKVGSFTYAGVPLGTLISMPITGLLSKYKHVGWPVSFYLFGGLGMAWSILWACFGSESPSQYRNISEAERGYIEYGSHTENDKKVPTPWKSILMSLPFWAILICHCGENWGYWTLLTEIPSYLQKILNFDIASNSVLSALPYFFFWILSFAMGPTADYLIEKRYIDRTNSRKIFTSIAMFVPVITLVSVNFVDGTAKALTIFLLVLSVGSTAGIFSGYYINHIDLAPNHAGALMGITTMISNICSLLAPLSVDLIIYLTGYQETDKELWSVVFYVAAGTYLVTGLFYVYGASAEVQPWNDPNDEDINDKDTDLIKDD
ncbi:hypothetical protein NQ315_001828 [Exocentrus adspersus]|uniref:Putative inorganic phosphate cotransporter n=1 Tax=Exocentrus adspersus TaxID=1586481 RepID=A0AAV8WAK3_9CUCU|nr:hypothetical protein NQ315_001828 [Exocentrus adspersus]